jgi:HK97 gp10 family phage protein
MRAATVQVEGLAELRQAFKQAPEKVKETLKPIINLRAQKLRLTTQQRAPYRTGRLRNSLTVVTRGLQARVITDVPYARYVEFGTAHREDHPFMRPAAEEHRAPFAADIRGASRQIERDFTVSRFL